MRTGYLLEQQEAALLEREPQGGHADGAFPLRGTVAYFCCSSPNSRVFLCLVHEKALIHTQTHTHTHTHTHTQGGHSDDALLFRGKP